jgi:hypothetical protein
MVLPGHEAFRWLPKGSPMPKIEISSWSLRTTGLDKAGGGWPEPEDKEMSEYLATPKHWDVFILAG